MGKSLDINVHHLTRVEGHGNIVVRAEDGQVEKCVLEIVETPRVFESMIEGLPWRDTALLTCRICGICSVGHTTASIRATDDAFDLEITPETLALRKAMLLAEEIQSHILHVYFLAAPDAFDAPSVIPLASSHPEVVKRALKLKKLGNVICGNLAGRHVHPIAMQPGGFTYVPPKERLAKVREYVKSCDADIDATVETIASIADAFPKFEREREDLSLTKEEEKQLNERGRKAAEALGLEAPCFNPYYNNLAQTVEIVHFFQELSDLTDRIMDMEFTEENLAPNVKPKAGRGIGLTEVPRGLLVHDYTYNDEGVCTEANCVIPTGMNLGNVDRDMQKYVPEVIEQRSQDEIAHDLEMLVRAYDPCISCSVHLLKVDWV